LASTERARRPFPAIVNVNHLIRLLRLLLRPRGPIISPLLPCRTHFRVGPTDLDILGHVNNGKYFSLMDLARVDLIGRAGLLPHLRRRGWVPVVVAETIQLRRSLSLFQAFVIHTRVLGWDDKAFVLDQHFERGHEVIASAIIRTRFVSRRGGTVPPREVLGLLDLPGESPALPPYPARWNGDQESWQGPGPVLQRQTAA